MNQKELKELIEFLIEKDIAEFELERGDVKVRIKRGAEHVAPAPPVTHVAVHTGAGSAPDVAAIPVPASGSVVEPRSRAGRRTRITHRAFAHRRDILRVSFAGITTLCEGWRHRRSRADLVHRGSNEADE